jgi:predicted nucleic acid-binding protein
MKYLLDSNILRAYTAKHPTLTRNLARIPAEYIGIPFVVVIEQLRGRFDAYLKAEPENLLREQERLLAAQQFLSIYQTIYVNERAIAKLTTLRSHVNTRRDMRMW